MRAVIISFLTLAIFLNSIELSSQADQGGNNGRNVGNAADANRNNIPGAYFEFTRGGLQTLINDPNVDPIYENGYFIGMYENHRFKPLVYNGRACALHPRTEQIYALESVVQPATLRQFGLPVPNIRPAAPEILHPNSPHEFSRVSHRRVDRG